VHDLVGACVRRERGELGLEVAALLAGKARDRPGALDPLPSRVDRRLAAPVAASGWVEVASKAMHYLLYVLLAAQAALGFVLRWSGNEAMSFFGLPIPPPFAPFSKSAHQLVGEAHNWVVG